MLAKTTIVDMVNQKKILDIIRTSPSVALLRARSCNLIIEFFTGVFEDTTAISHENIHSQLADFLNDHGVEVDEENDILFSDTYEEKAAKYVKRWTDNGTYRHHHTQNKQQACQFYSPYC